MNKTWLIIKREYWSRVSKKSFLLTTILSPLLFIGLIAAVIAITIKGNVKEKIAVNSHNELLKTFLHNEGSIEFDFVPDTDTSLLSKGNYTAVLLGPGEKPNTSNHYQIFSYKSKSNDVTNAVEDQVNEAVKANIIMTQGNFSKAQYDSLMLHSPKAEVDNTVTGKDSKTVKGNFEIASGIGYISGFMLYITLFLYGAMVMRGVMEEKTNRIAEVMVSSVKPHQLMIGKIIGIGAVGLTQFLLWIVLLVSLNMALQSFLPQDVLVAAQQAQTNMQDAPINSSSSQAIQNIAKMQVYLSGVNWPLIIVCFIFYFSCGYLFYAALFAAVGSAVNEDPQDAQSLMLPITMPIILSMMIMINAIRQPESAMATWSSIIPFTSPIVMMARIPFGTTIVPWWQLALSALMLLGGLFFTIWLSAKIYRIGILMYGKKPTFKELGKWAFRKN